MDTTIERVGDAVDVLGETPVWSARENALYWVDVRDPKIRRYDAATGAVRSWEMPALVGSCGLAGDGRLIAALRTAVVLFDPASGTFDTLGEPHFDDNDLRFNDGRVDRQGRFWVGSMNDRTRAAVGVLYRVDRTGFAPTPMRKVGCPNALSWSPDSTVMYYADSDLRTIFAYDFDPETGEASGERIFARTDEGVHDGATVDSDGFVWCAIYGAAKVLRYAPDGSIDRTVEVPVTQPTCCALGGADLRTLFITTASQRLDAAEMRRQPMAGGLLSIRVDTPGLPEPAFRVTP